MWNVKIIKSSDAQFWEVWVNTCNTATSIVNIDWVFRSIDPTQSVVQWTLMMLLHQR